MRLSLVGLPVLSLLAVSLLSGCSGFVDSPGITVPEPAGTGTSRLVGEVYGGQAALVGSRVYAYSSSLTATAGPGIAASTTNVSKSLITATPFVTGYTPTADASGNYYITTDANGYYEISSATTCTPNSITYLYSVQGTPAGSTLGNNTAAGLMVALGVCPAGGTLAGSLKSGTTHIHMNEISTVAAAYALAGFASDATHIGVNSTTNQTLANTGIQNAVNNAAQLYNYNYTGTDGGGTGADALATTPNGFGTVPQKTIDSLGNSLSLCVGQSAASNGCSKLLPYALSGGTTGNTPTDTATAAINIAHNPTANVSQLYTDSSTTGNAGFTPVLTGTPNDWTVSIVFATTGLTANATIVPHSVAVDTAGNVWHVGPGTNTLVELSPLGAPSYFTGNSLSTPYSVSLDITGNVWVTDHGNNTISEFTSAGAAVKTVVQATYLLNVTDAQFDSTGELWTTNVKGKSTSYVSRFNASTGVFATGASGTLAGEPYSIALTSASLGDAYTANAYYDDVFLYNSSGTETNYSGISNGSYGTATDGSNHAWITEGSDSGYLALITSPGATPTEFEVDTTTQPQYADNASVAIDGSGHPWVTDYEDGDIAEVNTTDTAVLSGTYGFLAVGNTAGGDYNVEPGGIAVDGSGNVWYATYSDTTIRELIGVATPVATPIVYGVVNNKLGARP